MSATSVVVEGCVTSPNEAVSCFETGAGRVELCHDLTVGGLTPRAEDVHATLSVTSGPVHALVRPRADTFCLDPAEVNDLVEDVASLVSLGVDGVVVGTLDQAGRIDRAALTDVVSAANGRPVTFHRAFDQVEHPPEEVETLMHAGVSRVLTSGGAETAWEGRETLRTLVEASGNDLTVLGGGRIRGDHVCQLVEETGLGEVHARASAIPGIVDALRKP